MYLCSKIGRLWHDEDFIDFYYLMQIGCIEMIYLCKKMRFILNINVEKGKIMSKNRTDNPNIASGKIDALEKDEIFVFGSNLAGRHLGGAAKAAHNRFGAQWGVGIGLTGQTYAIPTMQGGVETIKPYVDQFIEYAKEHQERKFLVTRIGCGIAGFKDEEIAPLFKRAAAVSNIYLPKQFYDIIVAPYLKHCFYYGKDVAEDRGTQVGHQYEER